MTSGVGSARVEVPLLFETDHQGRCYGQGETEQRPGGNGERFPSSGWSPCVSWSLESPAQPVKVYPQSESAKTSQEVSEDFLSGGKCTSTSALLAWRREQPLGL